MQFRPGSIVANCAKSRFTAQPATRTSGAVPRERLTERRDFASAPAVIAHVGSPAARRRSRRLRGAPVQREPDARPSRRLGEHLAAGDVTPCPTPRAARHRAARGTTVTPSGQVCRARERASEHSRGWKGSTRDRLTRRALRWTPDTVSSGRCAQSGETALARNQPEAWAAERRDRGTGHRGSGRSRAGWATCSPP